MSGLDQFAVETASRDAFDRAMMALALRMAARGLGNTAPNPAVGAVIADEATGEVIARGWTQPGGRPHAETEALQRAADRARGKTIYVTLEPCSHHGRTPPCADAIVAAGLARVVTAIEDPDPRVSGRGLDRMRAAGIEVRRGLLAREAHVLTRGHIVRVTERRPFVQLKMARGLDGAVPRGREGAPTWVTGPLARTAGHMLRARADAILIGAGTLRDDDPGLDCRLPGLGPASPLPVIVLGSKPLPGLAACRLLSLPRPGPVPLVAIPKPSLSAYEHILAGMEAQIAPVDTLDGRIWLPGLAEALVARGITRLLVEGGPAMWAGMLAARMVDEIVEFRAMDGRPLETVAGQAARDVHAMAGRHQSFELVDARRLDGDAMLTFRAKGSALA